MSFVDQVKIYIKSGNGGKGCFSFCFNKRTAKRYSDGGDGGDGGDIIIKTNPHLWDLTHLKFQKHFKAEKGSHGGSNTKKGRNGKDSVIEVPPGTIIKDLNNNLVIKDLLGTDESVLISKGGKGGHGNSFTKSEPTLPSPGKEKTLHLSLKLIAHAGLVGFPNAGKTTFINKLCKTKGKTANYPFTTLEPLLGVIWDKDKVIKIADIPGLIKEAHKGKGLGDLFLKHIQRTKLLIFVLGLADTDPLPWEALRILKNELECFDANLIKKDYIIIVNKIDLPESVEKLKILSKEYAKEKRRIIAVSALKSENLEKAKEAILKFAIT